jgi:hypothetical protein
MALLALEDGKIFRGESVGAVGEICEVVFNTALTGYQEIITDPSYRGQMITFTCTHIGNVGVNDADNESARPQCAAILAREIVRVPSNWRAQQPLPDWLRQHNIIALSGVDTRALTRHLRERGVMKGVVSTLDDDAARLVEKARAWQGLDGRDLVREVTCAAEFEAHTPYLYSSYETEDEARPTDKPKVMILWSGPNRIGQGIEFDYCCVQAVYALREMGYETVMVNCNPETISTDYNTADRLYLTAHVRACDGHLRTRATRRRDCATGWTDAAQFDLAPRARRCADSWHVTRCD